VGSFGNTHQDAGPGVVRASRDQHRGLVAVRLRGSQGIVSIRDSLSAASIFDIDTLPAGALVSVFVHAADGELVCRDDADSVSETFRCRPPRAGGYYVMLQNASDVAVTAIVRTERARDAAPRRSGFATVRVLFATNRQAASTGEFGPDPAGDVSYGVSDVSIPRDHRMGELEGPSILRLELRANPEKHVAILGVRAETRQGFLARVGDRIDLSRGRDALLFVHGFNVDFPDALRRTAQIAYDLGFDGAPILFSWPSLGSAMPLAYQHDVRNADVSADALFRLLDELTRLRPNIRVHVVAHSMGNRVLAGALQRLAGTTQRLRQVALLAPDIDAELFRQAAPTISKSAQRVTLYASSEDRVRAVGRRREVPTALRCYHRRDPPGAGAGRLA
jgi:esterase/lipase superfamily enzyme